jgi:hypothetical protein
MKKWKNEKMKKWKNEKMKKWKNEKMKKWKNEKMKKFLEFSKIILRKKLIFTIKLLDLILISN